MPQAITIEVRPFVDRSLVTIQNAMDDIDEMVEPTAADVFDALKPAVWGSTNDWCIRITRSVGRCGCIGSHTGLRELNE